VHVSQETTAAATTTTKITPVVLAMFHTAASATPPHVLHLVVTAVVIIVMIAATSPAAATTHESIKIACSTAAAIHAAAAAGSGALEVDDPVATTLVVIPEFAHAMAVFLIPPALVADAVLELIAAVAPAAAPAGAAHDLGGRTKVVVAVAFSTAAPGILHISQETASSHAVADSRAVAKIVHVVDVHAPTAATAPHHAIPRAAPAPSAAHPALEVFDLVHPGAKAFKVAPGPAPGAIDVVPVLAVHRVLHGAAVLGEVHPSRAFPLGELSGAVLEVPPAVVVVISSAVVTSVFLGTPATRPLLAGPLGVFATRHEDPRAVLGGSRRVRRKRSPGHKGLGGKHRSRHDCSEEEEGVGGRRGRCCWGRCELHDKSYTGILVTVEVEVSYSYW
jgi:hypothetical protein